MINRCEYGIMVSVYTETGPHHTVTDRTPYLDKIKETYNKYVKLISPDIHIAIVRRTVSPWETIAISKKSKLTGNKDIKLCFVPSKEWEYED